MGTKRKKGRRKKSEDFVGALLEALIEHAEKGEKPSFAFLLEELLNELMWREREEYLKNTPWEVANGYYQRRLFSRLGELNLKVPRVRFGHQFRPAILPPRWKRVNREYEELLLALLANGYSKGELERTLKALGLPYSREEIEGVKEFMRERLSYYKERDLSREWFCVFIDAYHGEIRNESGGMTKMSLYVAVGIDVDAKKEVVGFWVRRGGENQGFWVEVLQDLINRGMHRVVIFVTDNFRGVKEIVKKLFPLSDHQLCFLHLKRNLSRQLTRKLAQKAVSLWRKVKEAENIEEGRVHFDQLVSVVEEEKPNMAKELSALRENYLTFLKYPESIRRYIYTTNAVESLFAGVERMRMESGGYFATEEAVEVNFFIQVANLQDAWWRRPVPGLVSYSYEMRQMFSLKFELQEEDMIHNF